MTMTTTKNDPPTVLEWHGGPPPAIGWWPASVYRDARTLRFWDGDRWSGSARPEMTARQAAAAAASWTPPQVAVEWAARWWE